MKKDVFYIYIYIYTHTHTHYIHTHSPYTYINHKTRPCKQWNSAICNNVDGSREYYTHWNKPERKISSYCYVESKTIKQLMYITKKKKKRKKERERETHRELVVTIAVGEEGSTLWD